LRVGDTFYFNHPEAHRHLWVVAAGPGENGEFVIFNLTTLRDGCDRACILGPRDHCTIDRPTCVSYLRGRDITEEFANAKEQFISWQEPLSPNVLRRIQEGALSSRHTIERYRRIVQDALSP
jgi:hypothetical protein